MAQITTGVRNNCQAFFSDRYQLSATVGYREQVGLDMTSDFRDFVPWLILTVITVVK